MSVGHFQTGTMSTAKVLPECFPLLEIVRMWVTTIKPDPGAIEAHKGMDCLDVTVGRFSVGKMPPAALFQATIVLRGGAPFHPFEILTVRVQVQGDIPPLNKIGEMPSIPLRDWKLSWEQPSHGEQVPISYPHWGITAHILKVRGWRVNIIELPLRGTPRVAPYLHLGCWVQVTGHEAVGWQIQGMQEVQGDPVGVVLKHPQRSWDPGELSPQWRFQVPLISWWLMASEWGTPAAWRKAAVSAMASRLAQIATRIWTFSSCIHTSFLFWMRWSFMFWRRRIQERGQFSYKTGLLGVRKLRL